MNLTQLTNYYKSKKDISLNIEKRVFGRDIKNIINKYNHNDGKDDKKFVKAKITKVANQFTIQTDIKVINLNKYDILVKDDPQYVTDFIYEITSELKLKEVNYV